MVEGRTGSGVFVLAPANRTINVPLHDIRLAAEALRRALAPAERSALASLLAEPE